MTQPMRKRQTVLVVDDSEETQELLRENLEHAGYEVLVAHNGRDALAILVGQVTPGLIIIDLLMPVMDGMELIDVLRSYRRLAQIPLLVVSGVDVPPPSRLANVRYLRKPIRKLELLESVAQLLGKSARA